MRFRTTMLGVAALGALAGCNLGRSSTPAIDASAPPSPHVVRDLVGPGCDTYVREHASGPGSPASIAKQPAATAIAALPQLTEFAAAVSGGLNPRVKLTAELNAGKFTIFAPTDLAFAKLPNAAVRALAGPESASALTELLRSHVVEGERSPDALADELKTLAGTTLEVKTNGDRIRVGGQANVVCGGLHTANATLYLIDGMLMPPATGEPTASPSPAAGAADTAPKEQP